MTARLDLLTFEDLAMRIEQQKSRARADDVVAGWSKLLEVAKELTSVGAAAEDPAIGYRWGLTRLRISGYQGISVLPPLEVQFDPTPGITVLHGPNGSGKSSIAEAIETALHGAPRQPVLSGRGGNTPLWERVHCGRDADEALIELELLCGAERLTIRCRLDKGGMPTEHTVTLHGGGHSRVIDLPKTTWRSTLAGHRPVFEYAAVERRVQLAKDLQQFLENLLAFGGCFDIFDHEVESRSATSKDAKHEWSGALKSARTKLEQADEGYAMPGMAAGLPDVAWPAVGDDIDTWLSDNALREAGTATPEITEKHCERLRIAAGKVLEALSNLEAAETSLRAGLAGPLKALHAAAHQLINTGTECPVCTTSDVDWFTELTQSLAGLGDLATVTSSMRDSLREFRTTVNNDLGAVHAVLRAQGAEGVRLSGDAELGAFLQALEQDGLNVTVRVRSATRELCTWVQSDDCAAVVTEARQKSDRLRQWGRARGAAVADFIDVWKRTRAEATESASWESATRRLSELRQKLREERAASLQELTGERVQKLLVDAGLVVKSMVVQGTRASIAIADRSGSEMTLAMLSAGQRNALLLSPLLVTSGGGGPFSFLILDDPVHALDQLRVDVLSEILQNMAKERRIVVLTHDERLREHLLAGDSACDARAVERDPVTGAVTVETQGPMWDALLQDAKSVRDLVSAQPDGVTIIPADLVRGLCRQALDNALRQSVLSACLTHGHDPAPHLETLDQANTTKERLAEARRLHADDVAVGNALTAAESIVRPHLDDWNRASHGNDPQSTLDASEVDVARRACEALLA